MHRPKEGARRAGAVGRYEGLIRVYDPPFTSTRHEALSPKNVFMARYGKDGLIRAIR